MVQWVSVVIANVVDIFAAIILHIRFQWRFCGSNNLKLTQTRSPWLCKSNPRSLFGSTSFSANYKCCICSTYQAIYLQTIWLFSFECSAGFLALSMRFNRYSKTNKILTFYCIKSYTKITPTHNKIWNFILSSCSSEFLTSYWT